MDLLHGIKKTIDLKMQKTHAVTQYIADTLTVGEEVFFYIF